MKGFPAVFYLWWTEQGSAPPAGLYHTLLMSSSSAWETTECNRWGHHSWCPGDVWDLIRTSSDTNPIWYWPDMIPTCCDTNPIWQTSQRHKLKCQDRDKCSRVSTRCQLLKNTQPDIQDPQWAEISSNIWLLIKHKRTEENGTGKDF